MPWRVLMIVNGGQLGPSDREKVEDDPEHQAAIV